MSNILNFKPNPFKTKVVEPEPVEAMHVTEEAVCFACKHTWQAVVEVPMEGSLLECPNCSCYKGNLTRFIMDTSNLVYVCRACEGVLYSISAAPEGATLCCAGCGTLEPMINAFDKAGGAG